MDLSSRELEVLSYAFRGRENAEIGQILNLSPLTVKNHIQRIIGKLGSFNRQNACYKALQLGLLQPPTPEDPEPIQRLEMREDPDQAECLGPLELFESGHVRINGQFVVFTATEFRVLRFFTQHIGRHFTRDQILDAVWEDGGFVEPRTVDVHVYRVRKRIHASGYIIETVRCFGYRMVRA